MPAAARLTDPDSSNGSIVGGTIDSVLINGSPAAVVTSIDSSHAPYTGPHGAATIVAGSDTVFVEGLPLARVGDPLSCGHSISVGSPDVEVD